MSRLGWRKSTFSTGDAENCVEVAVSSGLTYLRESDAPERVLATAPAALRALLRAVKTGAVGRGAD
ncbi:DUF397 domain-containing protein [Streptomyces sp. NPDC050610]|uniref:DUF397 domain-containing protein n=1 Tax=Streptomyces sp. NPDC050610 TaxID=3157097 RepID=UPI00344274C8